MKEKLAKLWDSVKRYLGVWAWVRPLNWVDPTESDWAPGWITNYIVIAEALALAAYGVAQLL